MAIETQGGRGGRRRYRPMGDINITPMVDVMLVLLIIFMVTAPLMNNAVNVDLPKANATPVDQDSQPLQVSVDAKGQVFLMNEPIALSELVTKLQAISENQKDRRIFVRGDQANPYGLMMQVMGTIITGGFTKVSLLTQQVGDGAPAAPVPVPATTAPVAPAPAPAPAPARPGRG